MIDCNILSLEYFSVGRLGVLGEPLGDVTAHGRGLTELRTTLRYLADRLRAVALSAQGIVEGNEQASERENRPRL